LSPLRFPGDAKRCHDRAWLVTVLVTSSPRSPRRACRGRPCVARRGISGRRATLLYRPGPCSASAARPAVHGHRVCDDIEPDHLYGQLAEAPTPRPERGREARWRCGDLPRQRQPVDGRERLGEPLRRDGRTHRREGPDVRGRHRVEPGNLSKARLGSRGLARLSRLSRRKRRSKRAPLSRRCWRVSDSLRGFLRGGGGAA